MIRHLVLVALAAALAGCSAPQALTDLGRIEYKSATQGQRLEVPPDLVSPKADDRFSVPQRPGGSRLSEFNRERAGQGPMAEVKGSVLPQVPGVRIERDRDRRWMVIDQPPAKVWPVIRDFWTTAGFALVKDSAQTGILETDWNETRPPVPDSWLRSQLSRAIGSIYTSGTRDKFLVRLEPAANGGTEVFLSHRRLEEVITGAQKESTFWTQQPADPQLEAEFLRRMMLRFVPDSVATAAIASVAPSRPGAASAAPTPKAVQIERDGQPALKLDEGFDRAWRQVGVVLDRSGFTVDDRDRSKGLYFVRYVDPQRESRARGLLDRITGSASKDLTSALYQIRLQEEGTATVLGVLTSDGKPASSETDRRIVGQITGVLRDALR